MTDIEEVRGAHQQADGKQVCRYCRFGWPCHAIQLADQLERCLKAIDALAQGQTAVVCASCEHPISYVDCPTGGWWAHLVHPADGHEAAPALPRDETRPPSLYHHPRWGCGCDGTQCDLRVDSGRDASANPSQVMRVTCRTHGLSGTSDTGRVIDNPTSRQVAQAMQRLDLAHQEQCR